MPMKMGILFDRFFRGSTATNLQIQGVGLGLSIVKRIVEGHRGMVGVHSEQGTGATFSITLPIKKSNTAPTASVRSRSEWQEVS